MQSSTDYRGEDFLAHPPDGNGRKVAYIDAARGIAILLVILCHAVQPFKGSVAPRLSQIMNLGQYGVQLFFAASALTLCMSWDRDRRIGAFWVRRLLRIAPMYCIGIIVYWLIASATQETQAYTVLNVALNATLLHGLSPSAHNSIVPGGWSIGTEILFYACFPFLVRPLCALGKRQDLVLPGIAAAWSFGAGLLWPWTPEQAEFRYHSLVFQMPVFLLGMWVYIRPRLRLRTDILATSLVLLAAFALQSIKAGNCLALAGAAAIILRLLRELTMLPRWLLKIGQASYSMYIVHFIFVFYLGPYCAAWLASAYLKLIVSTSISLVGTYVLASYTARHIEQPFIRLARRWTTPRAVPAPT